MKRTQPISYEIFTYPIKRNRSYPMEAQIPYETKLPIPYGGPYIQPPFITLLGPMVTHAPPSFEYVTKTVFFLNINPSHFRTPPHSRQLP